MAGISGIVLLDRGFNHVREQVFPNNGIRAKVKLPGWTDEKGLFSAQDIAVQVGITRPRAVIECMHAVWRRFGFFKQKYKMSQVPATVQHGRSPMAEYVRMAFALANYLYNPPFHKLKAKV
jgi:hypothetical protein